VSWSRRDLSECIGLEPLCPLTKLLLVGQVALSFMLLVLAGLVLRSMKPERPTIALIKVQQ
jgi:hypothetical protein